MLVPPEDKAQYVGKCGNCKSTNYVQSAIEVGKPENSDPEDHAFRDLKCLNCGRVWQDKFEIKAQEILAEGSPQG